MEFKSIPTGNRNVVQAYGEGGFRIMNRNITGSILLFSDRVITWPFEDISNLELQDFNDISSADSMVEILVVGCGIRMALLPAEIVKGLQIHGIALECMNTGAACRTYNLLLAEGRPVAAALIAIN